MSPRNVRFCAFLEHFGSLYGTFAGDNRPFETFCAFSLQHAHHPSAADARTFSKLSYKSFKSRQSFENRFCKSVRVRYAQHHDEPTAEPNHGLINETHRHCAGEPHPAACTAPALHTLAPDEARHRHAAWPEHAHRDRHPARARAQRHRGAHHPARLDRRPAPRHLQLQHAQTCGARRHHPIHRDRLHSRRPLRRHCGPTPHHNRRARRSHLLPARRAHHRRLRALPFRQRPDTPRHRPDRARARQRRQQPRLRAHRRQHRPARHLHRAILCLRARRTLGAPAPARRRLPIPRQPHRQRGDRERHAAHRRDRTHAARAGRPAVRMRLHRLPERLLRVQPPRRRGRKPARILRRARAGRDPPPRAHARMAAIARTRHRERAHGVRRGRGVVRADRGVSR